MPLNPKRTFLLAAAACAAAGAFACGGGDFVPAPRVSLATFDNASTVIGQPDFAGNAENRGGAPDNATVATPWGNPAVVDGRFFVPDFGNNRVLVFVSVPTADNASASMVLGQPDFATTTSGTTRSTFARPEHVAGWGGKLAVGDAENGRVLVWNRVPTVSGTLPDVVVGKPGFTGGAVECDDRSLLVNEGMTIADGRLIVSDTAHNRVLVWNAIPAVNGRAADLVLGQDNMTTCDANAGGISARRLNQPVGVWSDGTRLVVADTNNHRVLVWDTFPTSNGQPADHVLGQADMASGALATSDRGLNMPVTVASNGAQLFVADEGNNRVMVWESWPEADHAPADKVLGQPDFTSNAANNGGLSARSMNQPASLLVYGDALIVGEWGNNRYTIFR